jgi:hypothetical protein
MPREKKVLKTWLKRPWIFMDVLIAHLIMRESALMESELNMVRYGLLLPGTFAELARRSGPATKLAFSWAAIAIGVGNFATSLVLIQLAGLLFGGSGAGFPAFLLCVVVDDYHLGHLSDFSISQQRSARKTNESIAIN